MSEKAPPKRSARLAPKRAPTKVTAKKPPIVHKMRSKEERTALRDAVAVPLASAAIAIASLFTDTGGDDYDALLADARKLDPQTARELEEERDLLDG